MRPCALTATALLTCACALHLAAVPPPNDNFANATAIAGPNGIANGTTVDASREPGEPQHCYAYDGSNSVWWVWTCPANGDYGFDTIGSASGNDIALYRGSSLVSLQQLASNGFNYLPTGYGSYVSLNARKDSNYFIAVVGYQSGASGAVKLNYYQDNLSAWITTTDTNRGPFFVPQQDGSLLWDDLRVMFLSHYRTNQFGLKSYREDRIYADNRFSLVAGDGSTVFDGVAPPGGTAAYPIDYYNGRLLFQYLSNDGLLVYDVTKTGLKYVSSLQLGFPSFFMAGYLTKKGVIVYQPAFNGRFGFDYYDSQLQPLNYFILPVYDDMNATAQRYFPRMYRYAEDLGDTLWMTQTNSTTTTYILMKKGMHVVTHSVANPPFGMHYFRPDAKGGLLYWLHNAGTNGPVTYLDKKGKKVVDQITLPGIVASWNAEWFNGKMLYVSVKSGSTGQVACFSIGKNVVKTGEKIVEQYDDLIVDGKTVYATTRQDAWYGNSHGLHQFDASLAKEPWSVPLEQGDVLAYLGKGVWYKASIVDTPPASDIYITIFNAKGIIRAHTIHSGAD